MSGSHQEHNERKFNERKYSFKYDNGKFVMDVDETVDNDNEFGQATAEKRKFPGKFIEIEPGKIQYLYDDPYKQSKNSLQEFYQDLLGMNLLYKNVDKVIELSRKLIQNQAILISKLLEENGQKNQQTTDVIEKSSNYIDQELNKVSSHYKRLKYFEDCALFVKPEPISVGLKWKSKSTAMSAQAVETFKQSTAQIVPIEKTLKALFSDTDFQQMYTKYNTEEKHVCEPGIYRDFCCGSTFKNNETFHDPNLILIQIGSDDFEPCCAVKPSQGLHKMCGIYFQIRNVPENMRSKLNNIYLVALVSSEDMKSDEKLNDINEIIVDQLLHL